MEQQSTNVGTVFEWNRTIGQLELVETQYSYRILSDCGCACIMMIVKMSPSQKVLHGYIYCACLCKSDLPLFRDIALSSWTLFKTLI